MWTKVCDFFAVGLRQAVLDPKFDEEHDARISFGHRPLPACLRARGSKSEDLPISAARQADSLRACTACTKITGFF